MSDNIFDGINFSIPVVSAAISGMIIASLIFCAIFVVLYYLKAIAVYQMSVSTGIEKPWLAFIPFANSYAFGKLAEKYNKRDGTPSAKFSKILFILSISAFVVAIIMSIFASVSVIEILVKANTALQNDTDMTISMFSSVIPVIVLYMVLIGISLAYSITNYIALWRVFSSFDYKSATLYTVLSVFFSFLAPIFLFILRKNPPTLDYSDRIGVNIQNY